MAFEKKDFIDDQALCVNMFGDLHFGEVCIAIV